MKPHTLTLVDLGAADPAPGPVGAFAGFRTSGAITVSMTCSDKQGAFIFPSELLARRYAIWLLATTGATWMPVSADAAATIPSERGQPQCRRCGCTDGFACPSRCHWSEPDLCSECINSEFLESWTIYNGPTDAPGEFIARQSLGGVPTENVLRHHTLDGLRAQLPAGLWCLPRSKADAPQIVEVWL